MTRIFSACGLFGALLLVCGCGSSKPEVPSWFKGDSKKDASPAVAKNSPNQQKTELEQRVKKVETQLRVFEKVLKDLNDEKSETVQKLRQLGVKSVADIKEDNRRGQDLYKRLKRIIADIDSTKRKAEEYEVALDNGQAVLRDFKRKLELQQAGISDEEIDKVVVTITKMDERLKATAVPEALSEHKVEKDANDLLKNGGQ